MSEKRFVVENSNNEVSIKDKVKDNYPFALAYEHIDDADNLIQECLSLVVLLNEQQATINELQEKIRVLEKKCRVIRGLENERNCKVKQGENVNLSDYLEVDEMKNITKINIVDFIDDLIHERINECDK